MKYFFTTIFCMVSSLSVAQTDSTSVIELTGKPKILLQFQEREKPVINQITQVTGGTVSFLSNQYVVSSLCTESVAPLVASPGWIITCGSRTCQSKGYAGGYVSEVRLPEVRLLCLK